MPAGEIIRTTLRCICLSVLPVVFLGCSPSESAETKVLWDGLRQEDSYRVLSGTLQTGKSHFITRWFGQDDPQSSELPPAILGDARDAWTVTTPSRIQVELDPLTDGKACEFQTAVRRLGSSITPQGQETLSHPVLCEVFLREADQWQSLERITLPSPRGQEGRQWHSLEIQIPANSKGVLEIITRLEDNLVAAQPGPQVAWASPLLLENSVPESTSRPDVLLVTVDTFRSDALDYAPHLRRVLNKGQEWRHAISASNWTLPAYASLFTGLDAHEHGAGRGSFRSRAGRDYMQLRPGLTTLAERFQDSGYATGLIHQNPFLEPWTGLARGFERYVRTRDDTQVGLEVADSWWRRHRKRPRFLVLHLMAPHLPYAPPSLEGLDLDLPDDPLEKLDWREFLAGDQSHTARAEFFGLSDTEKAQVKTRYYAEIRALDHVLGPWMESYLNQTPPPILVFHSDHGEELWDEGSFEHGHSFCDAVVRVPLALLWPGRLQPQTFSDPVPSHRLGATLLDLCEIPTGNFPGFSLSDPAVQVRTGQPLYPSANGGRVFHKQQRNWETLDFNIDSSSANGQAATLDPDLQRALSELGYSTSDED